MYHMGGRYWELHRQEYRGILDGRIDIIGRGVILELDSRIDPTGDKLLIGTAKLEGYKKHYIVAISTVC